MAMQYGGNRNSPKGNRDSSGLTAEHANRFAAMKADEEQRERYRAEEEAKIQAERRVQEKNMDQTEALIAAIRAQVEKEKAEKAKAAGLSAAANNTAKKEEGKPKPTYKTISPEELARIEEKKRLKQAGQMPPEENKEGLSGGLGGLSGGPTLSNPNGDGPTLSDINKGQQSLGSVGLGGGLGIDITPASNAKSNGEESTITLNTDEINAAVEKSQSKDKSVTESVKVIGGNSTIIVEDDSASWGSDTSGTQGELGWVDAETGSKITSGDKKGSVTDDDGNLISVIPVKQRPGTSSNVQSAYNIDFDDDDDDDGLSFMTSESIKKAEEEAKRKEEEETKRKAEEAKRRAEAEEARRKAEEEAKRKAEEEARRKAEEEAKRKAEEEARRKAEEEAKRKAEEEARRKAEEEARRKAEEEARRKAEEEARRKAEEEARRKAEEEARRKAEEEAKRKAEEEARRKAEEEARRKAEEEARRKAEEEARRKAEEEARRKAEEEERKAEEEALKYQKMAEEAARKAEEARRALEEVKKHTTVAVEEMPKETPQEMPKEVPAQAPISGSDDYILPVGAEQYLGKYLSVASISDQILDTIKYISENPSEPRNIVILGQYGFGTTTIAEDFARSFHAMGICKTKTIARIKAGALNKANISDAISKLQGGCLVIENAGVITEQKLDEIYRILINPDNDVVVIMTGQIETLSKIFTDNVVISAQFKHLIQVHRITDVDVFSIAKNHAGKLGYPCEPAAENMLRRRMQEVESGNLDRVLKFVDNAISKAHNREMGSGDENHRLTVSDFE